jgi:hypothetical protein
LYFASIASALPSAGSYSVIFSQMGSGRDGATNVVQNAIIAGVIRWFSFVRKDQIDETSVFLVGSKLGGRVLVCDHCGRALCRGERF